MGYQLGQKTFSTLSEFVRRCSQETHPDVGVLLHVEGLADFGGLANVSTSTAIVPPDMGNIAVQPADLSQGLGGPEPASAKS